jgi:hypothetical protein
MKANALKISDALNSKRLFAPFLGGAIVANLARSFKGQLCRAAVA